MTVSLDDYRWLTGAAARPWLARAAEDVAAGIPILRLSARLRKELSPEQTHLVLEQVDLRRRARDKFSRAGEMFFTPLGLAQATDEPIARYKASRIPPRGQVADFCCGIGGDLLAIAEGRTCMGVDRDPMAAHLAAVNAGVYGLSGATVSCCEVAAEQLRDCVAWHIDPDRRPAGKRTVNAERFEPPWEMVEALLDRCVHAAVKLAPATELPADVASRCERQWIESRGECRQQVAWFGALSRHGGQCAATVIDTAVGPASIAGQRDEPRPIGEGVAAYIYEPCAAVRAARLTGALCRQAGLQALSAAGGYLTSDQKVAHPLVKVFQVLEALPLDVKRLAASLKRLGIGPVEVKKRGIDIDPEKLRRNLARDDGEPGVVLIGPVGTRTMAVVARRLPPPA